MRAVFSWWPGALPLAALFALVAGCNDAEGWKPPPPAGATYLYEYQGFKEQTRGGYGGVVPVAPRVGIAYGGAFNFREGSELMGEAGRDPFAESTPIDGVRFNAHLGPRGVPLAARVAAPAAASAPSPPPASSPSPAASPPASPAASPASSAPGPQRQPGDKGAR